jgi:hypothetical protein
MPRWKDAHYSRAAAFARQLGAALGRPPADAAAPAAPATSEPAAAAKPAAAPGPTAGSVFTAIPWKK